MAAAIQQVDIQPQPIPQDQDGQMVQRRVKQLHTHYLEKQKEIIMPWRTLIDSAALIAGVALAIFSGMNGIAAVFLGIGVAGVFAGLGRICMSLCSCLQKNQQAADAIISPGFYEYARGNPRQLLSSAENIGYAYQNYIGI